MKCDCGFLFDPAAADLVPAAQLQDASAYSPQDEAWIAFRDRRTSGSKYLFLGLLGVVACGAAILLVGKNKLITPGLGLGAAAILRGGYLWLTAKRPQR